ncbi:MAG TPA: hypothetical protein VE177_06990 [Candidatus Binatus sp.]|nr:hypothetical protein [Candidatus Binatus sp.]
MMQLCLVLIEHNERVAEEILVRVQFGCGGGGFMEDKMLVSLETLTDPTIVLASSHKARSFSMEDKE